MKPLRKLESKGLKRTWFGYEEVSKQRRHYLVRNQSIVCFLLCASQLGGLKNTLALDAPSASVRPVQSTEKSGNLAITIEASRPQLTAGSGFGLTAELKNTSDKAITITPRTTILEIPPELQGRKVPWNAAYYAFFPTETAPDKDVFAETVAVVIPAKNSYIVKWAWDRREQGTGVTKKSDQGEAGSPLAFALDLIDTISSELQFMFFSPGDYKVDVVSRYQLEGDGHQYQTVIQSALIHVNAPESVILFGAMIGGFLGNIISRIYRTDDSGPNRVRRLSKLGNFVAGASGSMLLAAIVTILLARISESQFLVRININDFWGAIAVGFIASISGIKILDKLITPRATEPDRIVRSDRSEGAPTDHASAHNSREAIRAVAHSIYEERQKSGREGNEISDWVEAEKQLGVNPTDTLGEQRRQRKIFFGRLFRFNSTGKGAKASTPSDSLAT